VNWFRKGENGEFLWPGFGENMRVLKWIIDRVRGRASAKETPIGWMPRYEDVDWTRLDYPREEFDRIQAIDHAAWRAEVIGQEEFLAGLQDQLPPEMTYQRQLLISRL
jgi:phosphoenolpyruvate carboxykinase (GTP)